MYSQMVSSFIAQSHNAGRLITHEQAARCAAYKIDVWRKQGFKAATTTKVGRIPDDWPDVDVKPERAKRVRRAAPGESEAEIQKAIITYLVRMGWLVVRMNSSAQKVGDRYLQAYRIENTGSSAGIPDILCCKDGRWLLLEVKTEQGRLSESQKDFHDLAARFGAEVHVVRSVDDTIAVTQSRPTTRPVGPPVGRNQRETNNRIIQHPGERP
jgi:Holliday junction resolvase